MPLRTQLSSKTPASKSTVRSICINDTIHYDIFSFPTINEIEDLMKVLSDQDHSKQSQWYGNLIWVKTVRSKPIYNELQIRAKQKCQFCAILPAKLQESDMLACVLDEFESSLFDFFDVAKNKAEWFPDPNEPRNGDIEESNSFVPSVFVSLRVSQLWEQKPRQLYLEQVIGTAIKVFRDKYRGKKKVSLIFREDDAYQCGLLDFSDSQDDFVTRNQGSYTIIKYLKLNFNMNKLNQLYNAIVSQDGIVWDALIHINDLGTLGYRGKKLSVRKVADSLFHLGSISKDRCINPGQLAAFIRTADPDNSTLDEEKVQKAVRQIMISFNDLGYSHEQPQKFVDASDHSTHAFQLSGDSNFKYTVLEGRNEILSTSGLEPEDYVSTYRTHRMEPAEPMAFSKKHGQAHYHPFSRTVVEVVERGYRVKSLSIYFWISLSTGLFVPIIYIAIRTGEASLEDMLSASLAIVAVYIAGLVTLVLTVFYKGEELNDVIRNIREVNTQEEFKLRAINQTSDIIEILRLAKIEPLFLGGGSNLSFIRNAQQSAGFDADEPIAFSNLEVMGFGLYEDEIGNMFMLNVWNTLFKVTIVDNNTMLFSESNDLENSEENHYIQASHKYRSTPDMTLYCLTLKTEHIEKFQDEESLKSSSENKSPQVDERTGCLCVKYNSFEGRKRVYISRILPHGARKRRFGIIRGRAIRGETTKKTINNSDLLRMDVGVRKQPFLKDVSSRNQLQHDNPRIFSEQYNVIT